MEGNAESAFKEVKEMFNNAFSWLKSMMTSVKYKLGRSENNTIKKQVNNIQKSIQIIRSVMANAEANAEAEADERQMQRQRPKQMRGRATKWAQETRGRSF